MALVRFEPCNLLARRRRSRTAGGIAAFVSVAALGFAAAPAAAADDVERFTATTTNLEPEGLTLRIDVLRWSDEDAAAAVVAALQSDEAGQNLDAVSTTGYIWPQGSPVGYSIKYARRDAADAGSRLTFVTSRELGSYDFGGWTVANDPGLEPLDYTIIELDLPESGSGSGLASLAAPVDVDAAAGTVRLNRDGDPQVLFTDVRALEPGN